jgi:DNA-binding transcriptional regulator YhcF (GntR family)
VNCRVDPHSLVPPSQQLVAAVLDAIAAGELAPGDKLPSVRGLAAEALVNPNTVAKAFRDLEHLGVTEGRNGAGVFVTAAGPEVAKAIRLAETLAAFRGATQLALRAGHEITVLREALDGAVRAGREAARETPRTSGRGSKA